MNIIDDTSNHKKSKRTSSLLVDWEGIFPLLLIFPSILQHSQIIWVGKAITIMQQFHVFFVLYSCRLGLSELLIWEAAENKWKTINMKQWELQCVIYFETFSKRFAVRFFFTFPENLKWNLRFHDASISRYVPVAIYLEGHKTHSFVDSFYGLHTSRRESRERINESWIRRKFFVSSSSIFVVIFPLNSKIIPRLVVKTRWCQRNERLPRIKVFSFSCFWQFSAKRNELRSQMFISRWSYNKQDRRQTSRCSNFKTAPLDKNSTMG